MYNLQDILNLLKNKNREYVTTKMSLDEVCYLVKRAKNENLDDFYKYDLVVDEVKKVKEDFFYCKRILNNGEAEDFYLKKITVNEKLFLNFTFEKFMKNEIDLDELKNILKEIEESEIFLIIADRVFDYKKEIIEDTIQFPFLAF